MKIYVGCLASKHTGGLTLAHQLCRELRNLGYEAYMYYYYGLIQKRTYPVNEHYVKFDLPFVYMIDDEKDNVVIAPETNVEILRHLKYAQKVIWWMSVDNYFLTQHTLKGKIINVFGLRRYRINQPGIYHLAQSYYAMDFLRGKVADSHLMYLSDYLDDEFMASVHDRPILQKTDKVLYNPSKGYEFTKKIMDSSPDLEWFPLKSLSPTQMREVMETSKVYIDFGNHPGKDRIPREAAISGCCVITGKRGAARFYQDVPIPEEYKFDDNTESIPAIVRQIKSCITDYGNHFHDFDLYRTMIREEHHAFLVNVKEIFKVICCK